jgi:hypothetical protein
MVEHTPDNAKPLAPTAVSYPSGNEDMKSWIPAARQAVCTRASSSPLALVEHDWQDDDGDKGMPSKIFSNAVPDIKAASWATRDILERYENSSSLAIVRPSQKICPICGA